MTLKKTTVHVDAETRAAAKYLAKLMGPAVPAGRYFGIVVRAAIVDQAKLKGWKAKSEAVELTLGERLLRALRAKGLTQAELADRIGVSRPTITHAANGKNPVAGRVLSWLEENEVVR